MSKEECFVNELIGYIFAYPDDDYMLMEVLCRKLYKHGLINEKDGEWTCNFIKQADTPPTIKVSEGEWLFEEYPDGYYHSECSICKHWFIEDAFLKPYNYCPNCGSRMKG